MTGKYLQILRYKADTFTTNQRLALKDPEGNLLAILTIESMWEPDKASEARHVFGTEDDLHPAVNYLKHSGEVYIGGKVTGVQLPSHYDFIHLRSTTLMSVLFTK